MGRLHLTTHTYSHTLEVIAKQGNQNVHQLLHGCHGVAVIGESCHGEAVMGEPLWGGAVMGEQS